MSQIYHHHPDIVSQVTSVTMDLPIVPCCVYFINTSACIQLHALSRYFILSFLPTEHTFSEVVFSLCVPEIQIVFWELLPLTVSSFEFYRVIQKCAFQSNLRLIINSRQKYVINFCDSLKEDIVLYKMMYSMLYYVNPFSSN